jgi:hypothetical protein
MGYFDDELGPAFGNPNLQRQGKKIRQLAAQRDVNTMPDPRTYAFASGLLGTAPDEMGFSAMHPAHDDIEGAGQAGFALSMISPFKNKLKGLPVGGSIRDVGGDALQAAERAAQQAAIRKQARTLGVKPTVKDPERIAYPDIYKDPKDLVAEAKSRVAPEDPMLQQLWGVGRDDLYEISKRQGNITERPFKAAANGKGAAHAGRVMTRANENRITGLLEETRDSAPELYKGMSGWYVMDPVYQRLAKLVGPERAVEEYKKFNTYTGMASPGSEVLTETNRGTAANWLAHEGRFDDFRKYGGVKESARGEGFPDDMRGVISHPYHPTAHAGPMAKYAETGEVDMGSAKVPSYIAASGVPETGFQTQWPVGDAHWSRLVGLPDVRGARTSKGVPAVPNASASVPEMTALGPWWKDKIAGKMGMESVPAQATVWGAGSGATGVTSPIGAGKLELLTQQIAKAAKRMGVSPEEARDLIITGKAHAGNITPEMAAALAAGSGGAAAVANYWDE